MPLNRRQTIVTLSAGLAAPFVRPSWAQARTLNITNWEGYISETAIPDFEAEFGIGVVYDRYSSSEEFDAKMLAGITGYDVAMSSGASLPRMIKVGVYHKLDRTRFKNYGNLDPAILKVLEGFDPGNQYGVPYMWGSVGFAYNLDLVKEVLPDVDLNTMEAVFLPENAAKLAGCGISLLDSPADIGFMVLKWKGIDPALAGQAELDQMIAAFDAIRPSILTFDNTNYTSRMANGEICVANSYSGDYSFMIDIAAEVGIELNLGYFVPKTGAPAWLDCWCIPEDAANKDDAYTFIDYMMRPEVAAACTNFTRYANANKAATSLVDPVISNNPAVYPDAETLSRMFTPAPYTDAQESLVPRAWTRAKSG